MIKHKPIPKTDVKIDGIVYKCNNQGILELPNEYKQFNPIKTKKKNVAEEIVE